MKTTTRTAASEFAARKAAALKMLAELTTAVKAETMTADWASVGDMGRLVETLEEAKQAAGL